MKHFQMKDMQLGYFVGDFEPTVYKCENVEMALKKIGKGTLDAGYSRSTDSEVINILSGHIICDGKDYYSDDILLFEPGDMINLFANEDSLLLISRFPGTKNDLQRYRWNSYEELEKYYRPFINKLKQLVREEGVSDNNIEGYKEDKPKSSEITVVVQGYADKSTNLLLKSIRKYLTESTIILSTWDYCNVEDLDYDELVINEDPGAIPCEIWDNFDRVNNGNRQIVSSSAGLKRVQTRYTLKLRSDLVLLGSGFLDYFNMKLRRNSEYSLFKRRIIIGELFSRHNFVYHRGGKEYDVPKPFHPSDWFAFGLTSDVKDLYENVPLIKEEELRCNDLVHPEYVEKYCYKYSWKYTTEQHIFLNLVRHFQQDFVFRDWTDWNDKAVELSDCYMLNNFIFLDMARSEIMNTKYVATCFSNNSLRHPEKKLYTFDEMIKKEYESV